jgi:hypothetical protein
MRARRSSAVRGLALLATVGKLINSDRACIREDGDRWARRRDVMQRVKNGRESPSELVKSEITGLVEDGTLMETGNQKEGYFLRFE